jgi:hypothetical protein
MNGSHPPLRQLIFTRIFGWTPGVERHGSPIVEIAGQPRTRFQVRSGSFFVKLMMINDLRNEATGLVGLRPRFISAASEPAAPDLSLQPASDPLFCSSHAMGSKIKHSSSK